MGDWEELGFMQKFHFGSKHGQPKMRMPRPFSVSSTSDQRGITLVEMLVVLSALTLVVVVILLSVESNPLKGTQDFVGSVFQPIFALVGLDLSDTETQKALRIEFWGGIIVALFVGAVSAFSRRRRD